MAHLHLGIVAYALVNTIRCKLKRHHIQHNWQEIVRIGNTQTMITTAGYNAVHRVVQVRKCSEPSAKLRELQAALQIRSRLFRIIHHEKSVVHKPPDEKNEEPENSGLSSA